MNTTWLTATGLTVDLLIFTCLVIFIITPKAGRKEFLLLFLALLFSFINDALGFIGGRILGINMNVSYTIGQFLIYPSYLLFYKTLIKSKAIGMWIYIMVVIFVGFNLTNLFFIQGFDSTGSYSFSLRNVFLIIMSLIYFYVLIKELPTETITKLPMFWVNTAVLIYFAGTFFQYLLADYMVRIEGDIVNTWAIKNFLGIIYYSMLSAGLWLNRSLYSQGSVASV